MGGGGLRRLGRIPGEGMMVGVDRGTVEGGRYAEKEGLLVSLPLAGKSLLLSALYIRLHCKITFVQRVPRFKEKAPL